MAVLIWTRRALRNLSSIHEYIAMDSARNADRVIEQITSTTDRLRDFPASGRMVPGRDDPTLREVIVGSYRVIYRYRTGTPDRVSILTVIHGSQQLPRFGRSNGQR